MTILAVQNVYDTTDILSVDQVFDRRFLSHSVGLNVVKFKGWELVGWLVVLGLTAL